MYCSSSLLCLRGRFGAKGQVTTLGPKDSKDCLVFMHLGGQVLLSQRNLRESKEKHSIVQIQWDMELNTDTPHFILSHFMALGRNCV